MTQREKGTIIATLFLNKNISDVFHYCDESAVLLDDEMCLYDWEIGDDDGNVSMTVFVTNYLRMYVFSDECVYIGKNPWHTRICNNDIVDYVDRIVCETCTPTPQWAELTLAGVGKVANEAIALLRQKIEYCVE